MDRSKASAISPDSTQLALTLLEIIELKWLLAGQGVRVHVERLQQDPQYAAATLKAAADSPQPILRATAKRLSARLGLLLT
jgi:hypothetical protein